jgi:hypothetical protein
VGQQRGDLDEERPSVHTVALLVRRREQVGGTPQVTEGELFASRNREYGMNHTMLQ